jgi:sugar-specific transcriptional regulator TrmB
MQEDLVIRLENFGFTINQAKVYLSIVQSGPTNVGRISKITQLHRQDIYKLLPKLEKMGLIARTIETPFTIQAIPVEKALDNLVSKEKTKATERIAHLENNLKEIVSSLREQPLIKEATKFSLLSTDEAIRNRGQLSLENSKELSLVTSLENIKFPSVHYHRHFLQKIAHNNTKTRLIVVTRDNNEKIKQVIEKIAAFKGPFIAKSINKIVCNDFQIVDNKEIWIATEQETDSGAPCVLWTNDRNILSAYKENFKKVWNRGNLAMAIGMSVSWLVWVAISFLGLFC